LLLTLENRGSVGFAYLILLLGRWFLNSEEMSLRIAGRNN
jgi:hypothetical protein